MSRVGLIHMAGPGRDGLVQTLQDLGFACVLMEDLRTASRTLHRETLDVLLLDWRAEARASDTLAWVRAACGTALPVLAMAAAVEDREVAVALEQGADDVLVNPSPVLLRAKLRAALRRAAPPPPVQGEMRLGAYVIDRGRRTVGRDGRRVDLTPREFALAELLFANAGRKLSRGYVMDAIWRSQLSVTGRTLDTHVSRVRNKLGLDGRRGVRLTSLYGYGYRLDAE